MALWLTWKTKTEWCSVPHDPDDLNRCIKLLNAVPELRARLKDMAKLGPVWKRLVEKWDLIEVAYINEAGIDWCKKRSAPHTYELMRELIDGPKASA